jgi:hypothetical protein
MMRAVVAEIRYFKFKISFPPNAVTGLVPPARI